MVYASFMANDKQAKDLEWLRKQLIVALAIDDELFEVLILKGGNALNLLHGIGERSSLDLDYSLSDDLGNQTEFAGLLWGALEGHLQKFGISLFDWKFFPRPSNPGQDFNPDWGGYNAEFKIIETTALEALGGDTKKARKAAWGTSPGGGAKRTYKIELSKFEHCDGAQVQHLEEYEVRVYTLAMIASEKLRAICQQMEEYPHRKHRASRARDFYDIHSIVTEGGIALCSDENQTLIQAIFAAKGVELRLLSLLGQEREFHRGSWPTVEASIPAGRSLGYDAYFDFVLDLTAGLKPLWEVDAP